MPPVVIAAGVAGAAGLGAAAISSSAAKKASKTQAAAAQTQIDAAKANREYQYGLNAPLIDQGQDAGDAISGLLNIGGDPVAAEKAYGAYRDSGGYQQLLSEGLGAVNTNAYARGLGDSGATLKALQTRGAGIADQSRQGYIANLTNVANRGTVGLSNVAGVGNSTLAATNAATQNAADAKSNAGLVGASNTIGAINGLVNAGAYAFGSSYGGGTAGGNVPMPTYGTPPIVPYALPPGLRTFG